MSCQRGTCPRISSAAQGSAYRNANVPDSREPGGLFGGHVGRDILGGQARSIILGLFQAGATTRLATLPWRQVGLRDVVRFLCGARSTPRGLAECPRRVAAQGSDGGGLEFPGPQTQPRCLRQKTAVEPSDSPQRTHRVCWMCWRKVRVWPEIGYQIALAGVPRAETFFRGPARVRRGLTCSRACTFCR